MRARYWKEALQIFDAHPALGAGASGYQTARLRYDLAVDASRTWSWDDNDRLTTETDSNSNITTYAYDSLDRCTLITCADGTHRSLVWSPRSNLTQETDPNGTVVVHTYDLNDRCISNNIIPGPAVSADTTFETFQYDGLSRLTGETDNDCASHGIPRMTEETRVCSDPTLLPRAT